MSWKSFVTAGLLCVLATPAFAVPSVDATQLNGPTDSSGHLDAAGNWLWTIRLNQSNPPVDLPDPDGGGPQPNPAPGSPLAAELGFTTTSAVVSVTMNTADFDDPNPGNVIFGWEDLTALGGTGACDSATPGNCPVGLEWEGTDVTTNPASGGDAPNNQIFTAFGSVDYLSDIDGKEYARITTARPITLDGATPDVETLTLSGTYGTGGNKGRIAELNPAWDPTDNNPPISLNYDTYAGTVSRQARGGDTNLDGTNQIDDFGTLQTNYNLGPGFGWDDGDYDGDTEVTISDFGQFQVNQGVSYTVYTDSNIGSAPGPGGSGGVPEPASMSLLALAVLGVLGLRFRR